MRKMVCDTDNCLSDLVDRVLCCNQQELMVIMSKVKERIGGWDQSASDVASFGDQILPAEKSYGNSCKCGQSGCKPGQFGHSGPRLDTGSHSNLDTGSHGGHSSLDTGSHGGTDVASRHKLGHLSSMDTHCGGISGHQPGLQCSSLDTEVSRLVVSGHQPRSVGSRLDTDVSSAKRHKTCYKNAGMVVCYNVVSKDTLQQGAVLG